jgi:hypothetical protein
VFQNIHSGQILGATDIDCSDKTFDNLTNRSISFINLRLDISNLLSTSEDSSSFLMGSPFLCPFYQLKMNALLEKSIDF